VISPLPRIDLRDKQFQLQGTNTYLLGTGRERLLIDTAQGVPVWIESLKSVLKQETAVVKKALITHRHHDHVGGISDLLEFSPETVIYKHTPDDGQVAINDGDEFCVDGATLKAIFSPGHTSDHMCFFLEEENALFMGDNVLGHGTSVFEDLKQYMSSLQKMLAWEPARAYPAHGQILLDGKTKIEEYIRHRKLREKQNLAQLQKLREERGPGPRSAVTSLELVKRIYTNTDPSLHLAAEGGTTQVLEKLLQEDVVGVIEEYGIKKWYLKEK